MCPQIPLNPKNRGGGVLMCKTENMHTSLLKNTLPQNSSDGDTFANVTVQMEKMYKGIFNKYVKMRCSIVKRK